jgi:hypothetical protein
MFGIKPMLMNCRFELTYFYDLLTYLTTIRAKVVMFGIKLKFMKCRFEGAHFYDLLTYLKTVRGMPLLERRIHDKIILFKVTEVKVHLGQVGTIPPSPNFKSNYVS